MMRQLVILASLMIPTAHAEDLIEYRFDMILFENISSNQGFLSDITAREYLNRQRLRDLQARESDDTPAEATVPASGNGPTEYSANEPAINYMELDTGSLDEKLKKIESSSRYRVITRKTWKQSAFSDGDSIRIDIDANDPDHNIVDTALTNDITAPGYLTGSVTFTFSRYIHLSTDLVKHHTSQGGIQGLPATTPVADSSHISVERKLRSSEIHYVDHPLLGILINIERIKVKQAET